MLRAEVISPELPGMTGELWAYQGALGWAQLLGRNCSLSLQTCLCTNPKLTVAPCREEQSCFYFIGKSSLEYCCHCLTASNTILFHRQEDKESKEYEVDGRFTFWLNNFHFSQIIILSGKWFVRKALPVWSTHNTLLCLRTLQSQLSGDDLIDPRDIASGGRWLFHLSCMGGSCHLSYTAFLL